MINDNDGSGGSPRARGLKGFFRRHRAAMIVLAVALIVIVLIVAFVRHRSLNANGGAGGMGGPGGPGGPGGGSGRGRSGQNGQNLPVAVAVATVTSGDIQLRIPALGTVTTLANVTVRTQISGILQKILFTEGQIVQQGAVIAQIDPRPYEAALETAKGNLARDQALLADARLDLKRYEGLVKEDSIAEQQLDTQRALVDQYIGTIQSDQGAVKTAEVNLIYTRIVAPVTGRVGIRQVDQGNYVTPGDANGIVVVNQVQPISVIFNIPEDNVTALNQRVREGGRIPVEAYDRANITKLAVGSLLTLDNEIDTTTGTVKLRAQFDNADGALFPNQFVNISLLQDVLKDQLIMPNSAVRRGAPNGVVSTFVYIINADNTVAVRPVTLGVVDGERAAVTAGLAAGEVVVTEGGDRLREGATVQLPSSAPKPTSTAPARPPGGKSPGTRRRPRDSAGP